MENMERLKALNILFDAVLLGSIIGYVLTLIISFIASKFNGHSDFERGLGIIMPVTIYIVGRILCYKEYKDETP